MVGIPALDVQWNSASQRDTATFLELLAAALDDFSPQAIHDFEPAPRWRVFFRTAAQRDRAADALRSTFGDRLSTLARVSVDDEDWARRSQAGLRAIRIGRIVVAPPWDPVFSSEAGDSDIAIVIDPSTGFGTGHHESTRLCLELLQTLDLTGRRAIDAGTGSGILAIAAWRLGASSVVAFDDDPDALRSARENITRNGAGAAIDTRQADLESSRMEPADVVLANLTRAVLVKHSAQLARLVAPQGTLIVSGFAPGELAEVVREFPHASARQACESDWAAALLHLTDRRERS